MEKKLELLPFFFSDSLNGAIFFNPQGEKVREIPFPKELKIFLHLLGSL